MTKKLQLLLLSLVLSLLMPSLVKAQNVQLHYDLGSSLYKDTHGERPRLTTTVELFRPDRWGSTFFFVDMNYRNSGIESAYWEIARDLRFWKAPFALHIEYNGGLTNNFSLKNAYLLGANYSFNSKDFSWGFGITPMYKYLAGQERPHSAQLTATWYANFFAGALTFTGFADLWGDRDLMGRNIAVFISEPQLWLNFNRLAGFSKDFNLSIGGELELSYNFPVGGGKFYAIPTLATKWTF